MGGGDGGEDGNETAGTLLDMGIREAGAANDYPLKRGMTLVACPFSSLGKEDREDVVIRMPTVMELRKDGIARVGKFLVDRQTGFGVLVAEDDKDDRPTVEGAKMDKRAELN